MKNLKITIPIVDISKQAHRQVVVHKDSSVYFGQPDTVLLDDGKTIITAYPKGHGGPDTLVKKSNDGGLTWRTIENLPENFNGLQNAPTLHKLTDKNGKQRLVMFVSFPLMMISISQDKGETWSPYRRMFDDNMLVKLGYKGYAPPKSAIPISNGGYLIMYHDVNRVDRAPKMTLVTSTTFDGGLTWSDPIGIGDFSLFPKALPCEPALIKAKDTNQILCLIRDDSKQYNSFMMTSEDDGVTWSKPTELTASLTGDRHTPKYNNDGRLAIAFRDVLQDSKTKSDYMLWVGSYDDIVNGNEGEYLVRLLESKDVKKDTGYSGLEILPDDTFVATTYCAMQKNEYPSIVSVRFKLSEFDERS